MRTRKSAALRYTRPLLWLVPIFTLVVGSTALAEPLQPNIVLMLSDNLGYGEIGAYGGGALRGAPTPRLDRLSAEGMRFTNFNVEVECTPSRSALMTGRLPVRSGTGRVPAPGLPNGLAPWEYTLGEMLSDAGYDTAIFGKWHLGDIPGRFPTDQGFEEWWGFPLTTDVAWYPTRIGFDPTVAHVPYLLEGRKGEPVSQVEPYTLENRPLIDKIIADKSIAFIEEHAGKDRPFFLFVSWSLVHHPYLPHPDFEGRSENGPFSDVMIEHDHRVGQILDALEKTGIADDTLVIYASDNGPDSSEYPTQSFAGPYRGYLGSAYEGSIRTPMILRWPGKVPAGRVSNEIVAILDLFPTLAGVAGGKVPDDRAIDGVDQTDFFLGKTEKSAREGVIILSGDTLMAVKWRKFKIFLTGDDPAPRNRSWRRLWAPLVYNIEQDPREEYDIAMHNLWIFQPAMRQIMPFVFSVQKYGLIQPGGDERTRGSVQIPFLSEAQLESSIGAIKRQIMKQRLQELLPFGQEPESKNQE